MFHIYIMRYKIVCAILLTSDFLMWIEKYFSTARLIKGTRSSTIKQYVTHDIVDKLPLYKISI